MTSTFSPDAAHISCIPTDVLSLIFVASIPDDVMTCEGYVMFPRPSIHQSPLVLGRVCRLWREVSLTTPRLRCKIQLGDKQAKQDGRPRLPYHRDLRRDSVTLREWLRRSGTLPLSIGICYLHFHGTEFGVIKKIIKVAILYIRRWKHFTLHLPPALFAWHVIFPIFEMANPTLESLHLIAHIVLREEWYPSSRHFKPHQISPRMGDSASMILTGHHNVRRLLLNSATITLEQFRLCISHCPLLEKIQIIARNYTVTPATLNETYTLLHLTEVELWSLEVIIGSFLDVISCPALEHILVTQGPDMPDDGHNPPWRHLAQFLKRSRPPLKHLVLNNIPMTLNDFLESFKEVPSLKLLRLYSMNVPYELFSILLLSPEPLLPTLQHLIIADNLTQTNGENLSAFALSRWNCRCMLEYSKGAILKHSPDCQSLQSLNIDLEDVLGTVELGEIIEQGFDLITDGTDARSFHCIRGSTASFEDDVSSD
ncbi:hypothetical protein BD410DRAFT_902380 [Rickenella mellea]|uniref:F-box domain-containing protein n=1 Tax=Rickenella mellea TaxID=50990 RepID=A0A4Y7PL12_9AGAM|nr:hypothetical protein BD410DRAFT_902380 [Rickenella mellea]